MKRLSLILSFLFALKYSAVAAGSQEIVVSIAPLHSLVQAVMGETGKAALLVKGFATPHGYQLKPSQLQSLRKAKLIFLIDRDFERFLERGLALLPETAGLVSMTNTPGLMLLENREGGIWESHDHEAHKGHGHEEDAHAEEHSDHRTDFHLWLDPLNGIAMINHIKAELTKVFPENADAYQKNAGSMIAAIKDLDRTTRIRLEAVQDKPFAVFHDGFQYYEYHYRLASVGAILLEPGDNPSVSRIREIRTRIKESGAVCVFQEPQYSDKLVRTVTEGTDVKIGFLDPLAGSHPPGPDLYLKMLEQLAKEIAQCLEG